MDNATKEKVRSYREGGSRHFTAHRGWLHPDESLPVDTRRTHCYNCLRPIEHPIHWRAFRKNKDWQGWKNVPEECWKHIRTAKEFNKTPKEMSMSRKSLMATVENVFDRFDDEDEVQEELRKINIGEKSFPTDNSSKIVDFLMKCMDFKIDVIESPEKEKDCITFLFQKKNKAPSGTHCGKCQASLPKEEMIHVKDDLARSAMKLETSSYVCDDCMDEYCNE